MAGATTLISEVQDRLLPKPAERRAIRQAAGVSLTRMARELGVHRATLRRWERGQSIPRSDAHTRYAQLLRELRYLMQ